MTAEPIWLAVETGGTKLLARLVQGARVMGELRRETSTAKVAIAELIAFVGGARVAGAGIAAFGPVVVDPAAANFGEVLATPKPGWRGANLRAALAGALCVPVAVDTDVNCAARAEAAIGAGRGCASTAYVTVGTGVGAGLAMADGRGGWRTLTGAMHPEMGHVPVRRVAGDDLASHCPFHGDCVEGLAAGPAVRARIGDGDLAAHPAAFAAVADYLGQFFATLVLAWSPHRIVAGGGVMRVPGLRAAAGGRMVAALGGYGVGAVALAPDFVVAPVLEHAGLEGALLLARGASGA